MSRRPVFEWTRAVMADADISGAAKTIAWSLAEHAGSNAVAWPRVDAVAKSVGLDERNVRKHVVALSQAGYLVVEDRRHLREPSWYWLALDGELVGDFNAPPKPRATGRKRPVETEGVEGGDVEARPDETAQSSDRAIPSARVVFRPGDSVTHDRAVPSATTGRNHPVPPIYSPQGTPQGTPQGARACVREPSEGAPAARFAAAYGARYRDVVGKPWMHPDQLADVLRGAPLAAHRGVASSLEAISGWLTLEPDADAAIAAVLDGAAADAWMREHGFPLARIAADPGRFASVGSGASQKRAEADATTESARLSRALEKARLEGDDARVRSISEQIINLGVRRSRSADPVPAGHRRGDGEDRARQGEPAAVRRFFGSIG